MDDPEEGVGEDPLLELEVVGRVPLEVVLVGVSPLVVLP